MQLIITDRPYRFVPPYEGRIWPTVLKWFVNRYLARHFGVTRVELRGTEPLAELIDAGHGVLLAPNHCRMSDPLVMQVLSRQLGRHFYIMASSHLFHMGRFMAWAMRRAGAFSVYREGVDRAAVNASVDILAEARRPLVIFPEGAITYSNDRLNALMAGVPLIARTAARRRSKAGTTDSVYTVPVAIKYLFQGDLRQTVEPILETIESRLSWRPQRHLAIPERIYKLGRALLTLKEMEFFQEPQPGTTNERLERLIDHLLAPLESQWLDGVATGSVIARVKELRKRLLPGMIENQLSGEEFDRRSRQLEDMYLAQQLSLYPPQYIASRPSVDRLFETVKKFEENVSGVDLPSPPIKAILQVGEAIRVEAQRPRGDAGDPLLRGIETQLQGMLDKLSLESPIYEA